MKLSLGIDTGGTYTDAVLFDDGRGVVAKAKSLTTRHDLSIGIAGAVGAVLASAEVSTAEIGLVSLSTTLATNALVEGRGGRVALVFIGFGTGDAERAGLVDALRGDPVIRIAGGHDPQGEPIDPLDLVALEREAAAIAASVTGFAVTSQFATRNSEHELAARDLLVRLTGLPVTCGHELSAKLNGPGRALTSVLNARLIGLITGLIAAAEAIMTAHDINAPLMVVRGDGSLMSAELAKAKPIETILSGPAASLVGASYLTGLEDAIVADIGGTTTDIALVDHGLPRVDDEGASVGGHRTMVEAVAITTIGLGGDSEVAIDVRRATPALRLGPRRVVPISMLAVEHSELVHRVLDQQRLAELPTTDDARFVLPIRHDGASELGLDHNERALLERAQRGPASMASLVRGHADVTRLDRLVSRGLLMLCGFTPTDASHVLGDYAPFDAAAAEKAASLLARQRSSLGKPVAGSAEALSAWVVSTLQRRSAETLLDVAFGIDGFDASHLSRHELVAASLDGRRGVADVSARITVPVVGLGASAPIYYPRVAELVRAQGVIPDDADVANAIGAVVGRVHVRAEVYLSQPVRDRYRVHHLDRHDDHQTLDEAVRAAEAIARAEALAHGADAGAGHLDVSIDRVLNVAHVEGEELFVDGYVTATASGRPRRAR